MTKMLLGVHVAGGSAALLSMFIPLLSRKGGTIHRRAGWVFVAGMTLVCITALLMSAIRFFTDASVAGRQFSMLLFYVAILTGAGMWAGLRVLRAKDRRTRGSAIDIAMAGLLAGSGALTAVFGVATGQPLFIAFSLIGVLNGTSQIAYWLQPPTVNMHWWLAHMGNMLGACIAATTAFIVLNANRLGLPGDSLIVWLGPTVVGLPTIAIWTRHYQHRFASGRPAASSALPSARAATRGVSIVVLAAGLLHPADGRTQTLAPGTDGASFEVASIKANVSGPRIPVPRILPGGQVQIVGVTLRDLIRMAYPARSGQVLVEGGPDWVTSARFDVNAKTGAAAPTMAMLRSLLEDRFKLRARPVTRDGTVFALVVARTDSRLGPGLSPVSCGTDADPLPGRLDEALERAINAPAQRLVAECGVLRFAAGPTLIGEGITMVRFASTLSEFPILSAPVVDRTGLTGTYNLRMQYRGDNNPNPEAGPLMPTALEEQLGLKLERSRAPVDVVVIEAVEQPEPD